MKGRRLSRIRDAARARVGSILFRTRREQDLDEELRYHLERETERLVAAGVDPATARSQARRAFGSVEGLKEQARDARGIGLVEHFRRDARHAARRLRRDWRFTLAAVVILGLGIGVNTAIFSLVNAVLYSDGAAVESERLVDIYQNGPGGGAGANSYPTYLEMAAYTDTFSATAAAFVPRVVSYLDGRLLRQGMADHTSASYLTVLGLRPALGRWFTESEDAPNAALVAVIGHRAWTTRFAADPSIVGRIIRIEGLPVTVVGVAPPNLPASMNLGAHSDFWLPIHALPRMGAGPTVLDRRPQEAGFMVKARLRDGVTVAQAQAAMTSLAGRLAREFPKQRFEAGIGVYDSRDVRIHPEMDTLLTGFAVVLLAIVSLVLAIACSNLATLLLVRGASRVKEVSVRLAVGATRAQLVRHLLTESVVLAVGGGAAGCALAWWTTRWLTSLDLAVVVEVGVDVRVLGFALALSLVTGIVFGLAPALQSTRVDLWHTLRDDGAVRPAGRRRFSLKNALVVFQVTVSVFLLGGMALALQSVAAARALRTGYAVDGVALLETDARYVGTTDDDQTRVLTQVLNRVTAIPGVLAASTTRGLPMTANGLGIAIEGAGDGSSQLAAADSIWAGPGFFETLQIPILFGRALDERDRPGAPLAVVVNEAMARRYFATVDAVGRRFRIEPGTGGWMTIVGVARNTSTADLGGDLVDPSPYLFYRSMEQWGVAPTTLVARTALGAAPLVREMQNELRRVNDTLPVLTAKTMAQSLEDSLLAAKIAAGFFGGLGALGMTLAGIGLYAVIAFAVSQRSREIGIRMALGARSREVVWAVTRDVGVLVTIGTVVGLTLSIVLVLLLRVATAPTSSVGHFALYRPVVDPAALLAIAAVTAAVGALASYLPARRASRLDPLLALRHD